MEVVISYYKNYPKKTNMVIRHEDVVARLVAQRDKEIEKQNKKNKQKTNN